MDDQLYSARCKACDRQFYPAWHVDHDRFEELCWVCLPLALGYQSSEDELDEIISQLGIEQQELNYYGN